MLFIKGLNWSFGTCKWGRRSGLYGKYSPALRKAAGRGEALSEMGFFQSLEEGADWEAHLFEFNLRRLLRGKRKKKSSVDLVQALHRVHLPLQSGVTEDILLSVLYWSGSLQSLQVRGKKKLELLLQVCSNLAICRCVMPHYTLLVYWPAHQLTWLNFFQLYYFYKWIIFFWPPLSMPSE